MRGSAPTSVAIGTTLEGGARGTNTQAPTNPMSGQRPNATTVAAPASMTIAAYGHTAPGVNGCAGPYATTSPRGHTASLKWRVIITVWSSRYVHGPIFVEKPAEYMRGFDESRIARTDH